LGVQDVVSAMERLPRYIQSVDILSLYLTSSVHAKGIAKNKKEKDKEKEMAITHTARRKTLSRWTLIADNNSS
jgi:hypothetical protein